MFVLIIIILIVGVGLYYVTTMDFKVGDGFTEMKKGVRNVDYKVIKKEEDENQKMLKEKISRSATALIFHNGKLLMLLRDNIPTIPNPDTWSLIGGTMEDGEEPLETLKREIFEEIGVVPANITYIGKPDRERYRYFAHMTDEEAGKIRLGDEGQKLQFFEIEELLNIKANPRMKKWVDNHLDKIKYLAVTPNPDPSFVQELLD